jgi:hypothetical protein
MFDVERGPNRAYQSAMTRGHAALVLALMGASCSSGSAQPAADGGSMGTDSGPDTMAEIDVGRSEDSRAATDGTSTPDTWANYAATFFATYCTVCHNAQDVTGRDYNVQANVASRRARTRPGIAVHLRSRSSFRSATAHTRATWNEAESLPGSRLASRNLLPPFGRRNIGKGAPPRSRLFATGALDQLALRARSVRTRTSHSDASLTRASIH